MHSHYNYYFYVCVVYTRPYTRWATTQRIKNVSLALVSNNTKRSYMFKNIHIFVIFSQLILSVGCIIMVEHLRAWNGILCWCMQKNKNLCTLFHENFSIYLLLSFSFVFACLMSVFDAHNVNAAGDFNKLFIIIIIILIYELNMWCMSWN